MLDLQGCWGVGGRSLLPLTLGAGILSDRVREGAKLGTSITGSCPKRLPRGMDAPQLYP